MSDLDRQTSGIQYHEPEEREPPCCEVCGADLEWTECWQCLGDGGFDLYEEDPLVYAPGQTESCDECVGKGGWMACPMTHESET